MDRDIAAQRTELIEMQQRMDNMEILKDRFANLAKPLPAQFGPSRLGQNVTRSFKQEKMKLSDSLAFAPLSNKLESTDSKELLHQALAFNEISYSIAMLARSIKSDF